MYIYLFNTASEHNEVPIYIIIIAQSGRAHIIILSYTIMNHVYLAVTGSYCYTRKARQINCLACSYTTSIVYQVLKQNRKFGHRTYMTGSYYL